MRDHVSRPHLALVNSVALAFAAVAAWAQLEPIPHPSLDGLESAVTEQLSAGRDLLATTAAAHSPGSELGAAYGELGLSYHAYGFLDAAAAAYRNAELHTPSNPLWPYALGEVERQRGRATEAIAGYRRALAADGAVVPALVHLAELLLAAGESAAAGEALDRALALTPEDAAVHAAVGQAALSRQDYTAAANAFENALALAPEANRLHYPLALAYRGLEDAARAQQHLALHGAVGARLRDPLQDELEALARGERVHIARGRTAFRARRYGDAASEFRLAIATSPTSVPALVNLGSALALAGDRTGAAEQFRAVLLLAPENFTAHFNLGLLAHQAGDANAAITHLYAAVALAPADAEVRFALALALERATDSERCLAAYRTARGLAPDRENLWLNPANVLLRLGRGTEAEAVLREGAAHLPGSKRLQEALRQLSPPT